MKVLKVDFLLKALGNYEEISTPFGQSCSIPIGTLKQLINAEAMDVHELSEREKLLSRNNETLNIKPGNNK